MTALDKYVAMLTQTGNKLYTIRIMDHHGKCIRKLTRYVRPCDIVHRSYELCKVYGGHSFEFKEEEGN